jgi:hypothetical protein
MGIEIKKLGPVTKYVKLGRILERILKTFITRVDGSNGAFPSFQAASKYVLKDMPTNT